MPLFKLPFEENSPITWPFAGHAQSPLARAACTALSSAAAWAALAAGALSLRQSVDAWSSGIDLLDHAATHRELARAFESFPDDADRLYPSWRSRLGVS